MVQLKKKKDESRLSPIRREKRIVLLKNLCVGFFYFLFYKSNPFDVRNDKESFVDAGLNNMNNKDEE